MERTGKRKRVFIIILLLILLFLITERLIQVQNNKKEQGHTPLSMQFGWIVDAHQAGFWVALEKGFYLEEGLDVKLFPGGLDSSPIKAVVSGVAQIGQAGGIEQVISAACDGLPIKAVASIHRDTPHALISLADKPITKPGDMLNKTIAVAYGDAAEILLNAYMEKCKIDKSAVKFVPFRFNLTPLINGDVDAVTGFATDQPAILEDKGFQPVILRYSSENISSYGYTLFCTNKTLDEQSESIRSFLKASRRGWQYTFEHPGEAVSILNKYFEGQINKAIEMRKLELIQIIMCSKNGELDVWTIDTNRVRQVMQYLHSQGQIDSTLAPEHFIVNELGK